jgi:hypothetical protein
VPFSSLGIDRSHCLAFASDPVAIFRSPGSTQTRIVSCEGQPSGVFERRVTLFTRNDRVPARSRREAARDVDRSVGVGDQDPIAGAIGREALTKLNRNASESGFAKNSDTEEGM